jgi:predicted lactoylglutathione lyase
MSTAVPARISIVTLGVADVERSARFYEKLGWERRASSIEGEIAWFGTADSYLGIFGWRDLADDATMANPTRGSFGGVTLAINVESSEAVDAALANAVAAGGSLLKPATEFGFGYGGYFADPDGHPWEVVWNRGFPVGPDGRITIP